MEVWSIPELVALVHLLVKRARKAGDPGQRRKGYAEAATYARLLSDQLAQAAKAQGPHE